MFVLNPDQKRGEFSVVAVTKKIVIASLIISFFFYSFLEIKTVYAAPDIQGTVYIDQGITTIGAGKTIRLYQNTVNTGLTADTDAAGAYSIDIAALTVTPGDKLTVYIDDETEDGLRMVKTDGATYGGYDIYQDFVIVDQQQGTEITSDEVKDNTPSDFSDIGSPLMVGNTTRQTIYKSFLVASGATYQQISNELEVYNDLIVPGTIDMNGKDLDARRNIDITGTWVDQTVSGILRGSPTEDVNYRIPGRIYGFALSPDTETTRITLQSDFNAADATQTTSAVFQSMSGGILDCNGFDLFVESMNVTAVSSRDALLDCSDPGSQIEAFRILATSGTPSKTATVLLGSEESTMAELDLTGFGPAVVDLGSGTVNINVNGLTVDRLNKTLTLSSGVTNIAREILYEGDATNVVNDNGGTVVGIPNASGVFRFFLDGTDEITLGNFTYEDVTDGDGDQSLNISTGDQLNITGTLKIDGLDSNDRVSVATGVIEFQGPTAAWAGDSVGTDGDFLLINNNTIQNGVGGTVTIPITPENSGPQFGGSTPVGWFPAQRDIAYTKGTSAYSEGVANDGSIDNTDPLVMTLTNDTYQDTDNDNLLDIGSEVVIGNVPAGLTPVMTLSAGDTVATLTFTGTSTAHENSDDETDITFAFDDSAFTLGTASTVTNAGDPTAYSSNIGIDFENALGALVEFSVDSSDNENSGGNLPELLVSGTVTAATTINVVDAGTGTATEGAGNDYTFSSPVTVTIPAGTYTGSTTDAITITGLSIIGDTNVEGNETIDFTLSNPTGDVTIGDADGSTATNTTQTYTITNDDSAISGELNYVSSNAFSPQHYEFEIADLEDRDESHGLFFAPDGSKYFISDFSFIYEYVMSTPFDVSTAVYQGDAERFMPTSRAFTISLDGTKLFVFDGGSEPDYAQIDEYILSTAFDVSTASLSVGEELNILSEITDTPDDIVFSEDGTKLFILNSGEVYQYTLAVAYDVSTGSYDGIAENFTPGLEVDSDPVGITFGDDGNKLFIVGNDTLVSYNLSAPYDVSTASLILGDKLSLSSLGSPTVPRFNPIGDKLYVLDAAEGVKPVKQFNIPIEYPEEKSTNNGVIDNTEPLEIILEGDTFTGANGSDLVADGKVVVGNIPTNLTAVVTKDSDTQVTLTFTGAHPTHQPASDVASVTFVFNDTAFTGNSASAVVNSGDAGAYVPDAAVTFRKNITAAPGGVFPNLGLWFKADTEATASAWGDQSEEDNDGIQNEVSDQPVLTINSNNFNPAFTFDGSDDHFEFDATLLPLGSSARSFFLVLDPEGTDVRPNSAFQYGESNEGTLVGFGATTRIGDDFEGFVIGSGEHSVESGVENNNLALYSITLPASADSSQWQLSTNGLLQTLTTQNGAVVTIDTQSSEGAAIGQGPISGREHNGTIAEVIAYDTQLTGSVFGQVNSYLALKYGLTLDASAGDYYNATGASVYDLTSGYDQLVIGIAKDDISSLDQQISKSTSGTSTLTISTDTNFTGANGTHVSLTDGQYLVIGANSTATGTQTTEIAAPYNIRTIKEWRVENTGAVGAVNLKFDGYGADYVLLTDTDGDFSTTGDQTNQGSLSATGEITGVTLVDGGYFTLAATVAVPTTDLIVEFSGTAFGGGAEADLAANGQVSILVSGGDTTGQGTRTFDITLTEPGGFGSMTLGEDFATGTVSVVIPEGNYTGQTIDVTVPLLDDSVFENQEYVDVGFANFGSNIALGDVSGDTTIISSVQTSMANDDFIEVNFSLPTYVSIDEGTDVTMTILVSGAEITASDIIGIDIVGGTATDGGLDYTFTQDPFIGGFPVTIPVGDYSTTTGMVDVMVTLNDDGDIEGDETVNLQLVTSPFPVSAVIGSDNTTVVTITDDEYPATDPDGDGNPSTIEDAGFNGGDGNGDGILDSLQREISGAPNPVTGEYTTLESTGACNFITENAFLAETSLSVSDPTFDYPVGLVDFKVNCTTPGDSTNVKLYYSQEYDTSNWGYRKYDSSGNVYSDISGLVTYDTFTHTTGPQAGVTVTTAEFTVTDGDPATDEDGIADGVINDPSGPAIIVTTTTSSGGGGGGSVRYRCRDPEASNYSNFGRERNSLCEYDNETQKEILEKQLAELIKQLQQKQSDDPFAEFLNQTEPNVSAEFQGQVCARYLRDYIWPNRENNPEEVRKLQTFLNEVYGETLTVDGVYDSDDIEAVKRYQALHTDQVLAPWGHSQPTANVYKTTVTKMNLEMCRYGTDTPYFTEYMKVGDVSLEAVRIQDFINLTNAPISGYPTNGLPLTKTYTQATANAVKAYQNRYRTTVLDPWGLKQGTGWWYQTTRSSANALIGSPEPEITLDNGVNYTAF